MAKAAVVRLDKIATFVSGGTPSKSNPLYWGGATPWLTPKDMAEFDGRTQDGVTDFALENGTRLAPEGTIFIAVRGMSLHKEIRVIQTDRPMTFNQDIKALIPKDIDGKYLYYALLNQKPLLLSAVEPAGHGTGVLPTDKLGATEIPVPDRNNQQAIAAILCALDDKIALHHKLNQTLATAAHALYKDWFIDFGPTRAKLHGRSPYFSAAVWSLFPDSIDAMGKPQGWTSSTIGAEVDVVGGSTPSTKDAKYWGGDIAWATPKDLSSLRTPVLLSTERKITALGLSQIGSGLLPAGTVLLSSRAPIGYLAIADMPVAINQGFIAMVCKQRLSNVFVWQWTQASMEQVHQRANGSTFQEISKANFRPIPVIVGTPDIHSAFDSLVQPMFERMVSNEKEIRSLATTRDFLLPRLMSGEVRVMDAEKSVGEIT